MSWSGVNSSRAIHVAYCRTKCNKLAVIYDNYYFHHNRNYKDGDYWCCAQRGCRVRLISSRSDPDSNEMVFARRNPSIQHGHDPNAPNLVDKEFRRAVLARIEQMNRSGAMTAASMRSVYDETRMEAITSGIPASLIPAFWNIRSSMYRIKRKRQADSCIGQIKELNKSDDEVLLVGNTSPLPPSTGDSESVDTSPEQTEPLCLVTEKSLSRQSQPSILLQTLNSPSTTAQTQQPIASASAAEQTLADLMAYPAAINSLVQYSKHQQPTNALRNVPLVSHPNAEALQQYAAFHAEYVRSLFSLNMFQRC